MTYLLSALAYCVFALFLARFAGFNELDKDE